METAHALDACQLKWGTNTGVWLTVLISTANIMDLGYQEWSYFLFLRYYIDPMDLPHHCDGCNAKILSNMPCKKGDLVKTHPNVLLDGVSDLEGKAFTPSHKGDNPLIHPGRAVWEGNNQPVWYPYNNSPVDT